MIPDHDWIRRVPKTDLHVHLGGSLRLSTILDEARRQKLTFPADNEQDLRRLVVKDNASSLEDYLEAFKITESVLKDPRALERAAFELIQDAHAENVKVLEIRYAPTNYQTSSLKLYQIVEAVLEGIERGRREFGMLVGLILCGMKHDKDATEEAVRLASDYQGSGVVGFDLAGPEHGYPPTTFMALMKPIFLNFIPVTIHAGEAYGAKSIAESINYLNARRIGHATNLFESKSLTEYVEITGLGLEICLSSNKHTNAVPSLQSHPARQMVRHGLRYTINTDNRLVSNTDMTTEMGLLVNELGFTAQDLIKGVKNGVKASFFRKKEKKVVLDQIDLELEALLGD